MDEINKSIVYEYRMFVDYIEPKGALTLDKACHACFYYTMLATKARFLAGDGIEGQIIQYKVGEEIPDWHVKQDENLARSIAIMYGLESPDEFLKFKKEAWTQAHVILGVEVPLEIYDVKPGFQRLQ